MIRITAPSYAPQLCLKMLDFEWMEELIFAGSRKFRERRNFFNEFTQEEFKEKFHITRNTAKDVLNLLYPALERDTARNDALSPEIEFLCALRFLTCGSYQGVHADLFNIHRTTVSRCIHHVIDATCALRHNYIRFPDNLQNVKQKFFDLGNMPGLVGYIDGTHIPIRSPACAEAEVFRCRKGFFSLNSQIVAGPEHKIYDVVARWPGSTHDSRIFNNSRLKYRLEEGTLRGILLDYLVILDMLVQSPCIPF